MAGQYGPGLWVGAAVTLLTTQMALAADPPSGKAAATAACADPAAFVASDCKLTYWGITLYGAVDVGVGWESHGAPLNRHIISGVQELIQKNGNRALWLATPNGMSQSFVGLKAKQEFAPGWAFVADWSFGFDPYTLSAANGPRSFLDNNGVPLNHQSSNADSSRAGQWYNGAGYVGVSHSVLGALTIGRQNALTLDGVIEYDPMGASSAFSVIGWSGLTAGAGDTEDARISSAIKYRNQIGSVRFSALTQIGGYSLNNGAQAVYEGGFGYDADLGAYGRLSLDGILTFDKGAVASGISALPNADSATISDDKSVMLLAKWSLDRFKISAGFEAIRFQNPADPQLAGFSNIAGIFVPYTGVGGNIKNNAYSIPRNEQVFWIGGRYRITPTLDAGLAYYHYNQQSFAAKSCSNSSAAACAGTLDAVSFNLDWQFAKKFDAYAGVMFSEVHDGLKSGYLYGENLAPTAGLRFRF